jgi:hybrid cluster-associated redox disulfide protein
MRVYEIIALCPEAPDIMAAYGLHCFSCSLGGIESIQEGCAMHGFADDAIDALVEDLNEAIRNVPPRPASLTVTPTAAAAIRRIAEAEGRQKCGLSVVADMEGGFCMEFSEEPEKDDNIFICGSEPAVRVFASPETLWRIGGATIDFRDGRFKLDL